MGLKNGHKDLIVWQKSLDLADAVYVLTRSFPKEEIYGLISQMRRCAVSIPSNIAEGSGRKTKKDFVRFLAIAYGSALELETQLLLSQRFGYTHSIDAAEAHNLLDEVLRMLNKMTALKPSNEKLATSNSLL